MNASAGHEIGRCSTNARYQNQQRVAGDRDVAEAERALERRVGLIGDADVEQEEQPAVVGAGLVDHPDERRDVEREKQRAEIEPRLRLRRRSRYSTAHDASA